MGVGTTQLYNHRVVYNHKRHGRFTLGGMPFEFRRKPRCPRQLTEEFLLADLLNNLSELAENPAAVRERARQGEGKGAAIQERGQADRAGIAIEKRFQPGNPAFHSQPSVFSRVGLDLISRPHRLHCSG